MTQHGKRIFVSCGEFGTHKPDQYVQRLRDKGFIVQHSPRSQLNETEQDPKWESWYDQGLPAKLKECDIFIIYLHDWWDSSTWLAEEAHQALNLKNQGKISGYYYYDPDELEPKQGGSKKLYLLEPVPDDLK